MTFTSVVGVGAILCLIGATIFDNVGLAGFGISLTIYYVKVNGT